MEKMENNKRELLRVVLVSPLPPPSGGIGRWTVLLLNWLASNPSVSLVLVDPTPRWRALWDLALWKRIVGGAFQGVWDAARILPKLAFFRPQVIHLNTSAQLRGPWDTVMLALARIMGVASVYHIRMGRLPEVMKQNGWEWWGMRGALRLANRVVVLDKESEVALVRFLSAERVVLIPNAIAKSSLDGSGGVQRQPTVLFMGHVVPSKGIRELMEAWHELRPSGWRLQVAGAGSSTYRDELLGIAGRDAEVEFLGDLPPEEAWECLQRAQIFVLPTYTEGFPNAVLEAMAAGKAIISTRVGAIPEMLGTDGEEPCGLLIEPQNTQALVIALRNLLSDPKLRESLGRRAQVKVSKHYTTDVVFGRLLDLWREVAERPKHTKSRCHALPQRSC